MGGKWKKGAPHRKGTMRRGKRGKGQGMRLHTDMTNGRFISMYD